VNVQYGVDATQLLATTSSINWPSVSHLVWNFPLATAAESTSCPLPPSALLGDSDEASKQLMGRFLLSAARLLLCYNPHIKVSAPLSSGACQKATTSFTGVLLL
jgi:hypothetical protein